MLEGKVCVVTGAGGGIGRACATEMAVQGAQTVEVCDIDADAARETVRQIQALGVAAEARRCDVAEARSVADTMQAIGAAHGRIDVLHNNAGILEARMTDATAVDSLTEETWDRVFDVNVKGTWLCTKHAVPFLRRSRAAAIVNCGSTSSFVAFETEACYCTSKAAILGLTRATALDLARDGIRCNCYCPSSTDTDMISVAWAARDREEAESELIASHLVPRLGTPEDVAKLVCFLASDDASFINGAAYAIDGGALAWRGLRS